MSKPSSLRITPPAMKWFAAIAAICAFVGPPLSFVMAIQVNKATTEVRVHSLEDYRGINDKRWDTLNDHLGEIEKSLYQIKGHLVGP